MDVVKELHVKVDVKERKLYHKVVTRNRVVWCTKQMENMLMNCKILHYKVATRWRAIWWTKQMQTC